ncbi:hypothetical protein F4810DRAFT_703149 [Camillea tinctor]|nr:hypothetical protein F4810DRAFT_703149 [Camillea tinctor]
MMEEDEGPRPTSRRDTDKDKVESSTITVQRASVMGKKENVPFNDDPQRHPADNSFAETTGLDHYGRRDDSLSEEEHVRAHFQDVESSFMPTVSPVRVTGPDAGIDDTYLFDAMTTTKPPTPSVSITREQPAAPSPPEPQVRQPPPPIRQSERPLSPVSTTPRPSPSRHSPHINPAADASAASQLAEPSLPELQANGSYTADISTTTSALETLTSSPTAAAAARTVSRAISMASNRTQHESDSADVSAQNHSSLRPTQDEPRSSGARTPQRQPSRQSIQNLAVESGNTSSHSLKVGKRPKPLRSINGSRRSSTSSYITSEDVDSDVTVGMGADYALQSGGAAPAFGLTRSLSDGLSRSISIGSMASAVDDSSDPVRSEHLEPLEEVDSPERERRSELITTPKAQTGQINPPTDTVIARHVRNVEVPESLAREYKTKGGLSTPKQPTRKVSDYTPAPTTARSGKNLTLKEQSSTIERLSKENFDLKLKVMFLSDRLDKLSEEGVKEMISENVELRTSLAVIQRDNKILRRRVKELEKRLRDEEDRPSTARSGYSSDGPVTPGFDQDAQEELLYLRERVEEYVTEIERLRAENMTNQAEKRRLAETVKTMGDRAGDRVGESLGRQEEADVWKDLLEQETARREQADDDNRRLRDELFRLKQEINGSTTGTGGLHHTTNIYNITRKAPPMSPSRSRPVSGLSGEMDPSNSLSQSGTLVEDLRRESEQLRHENAELRREVGAQTSMLTSRNREKERLYQEIEDLKLAQRRGGTAPSTVDSLFDRSASRAGAHERSTSRGSARTRLTMTVEDPEREELENKLAEHRDKINEFKFKNQELQRELESTVADFEDAAEGRRQAEEHVSNLQEDLDNAMNDLMEYSQLEEEIDTLEAEGDQKSDEIQRLQLDLQDQMRSMSEAIIRLEDDQEQKMRRIEQLQQLDSKLLESNEKNQRLNIQQESSQGEIAFLREEQEGDKIRIGDLEAALANVEQSVREERDRQQVQQFVNELNREASTAKDEVRKLRKSLTSRENNLREALGDLNGTRSSLLKSIAKLQRELEDSVRELDTTKNSLLEKDRIIKQRDSLLESHGLESRRLADMLDKERQAHRNTKNQFDAFQRTHQHVSRTVTNQDSHILELETSRAADKKKIAQLETSFKEQLVERNNLLLVLWTRLSSLCGTDWAHDNSLINGRALPSLESVSTMLPGFSKNLLAAVKTIEGMIGNFQSRVKSVERELWKEYQSLENNLESRTKKLDRLESIVRSGIASGSFDAQAKLAQLESAYRALKIENATLQRANDARIRGAGYFERGTMKNGSSNGSHEDIVEGGSPSPLVPTGPRKESSRIPRSKTTHLEATTTTSTSKSRASSMTRSPSKGAELERVPTTNGEGTTTKGNDDNHWIFRLRELEYKLKQEREARQMDRAAARQRIQDSERQNSELAAELVRAQRKGGGMD